MCLLSNAITAGAYALLRPEFLLKSFLLNLISVTFCPYNGKYVPGLILDQTKCGVHSLVNPEEIYIFSFLEWTYIMSLFSINNLSGLVNIIVIVIITIFLLLSLSLLLSCHFCYSD